MFEAAGGGDVVGALTASDVDAASALAAAATRAENSAAAVKVLAAGRWHATRSTQVSREHHGLPFSSIGDKAALSEIATTLRVSRATAGAWVSLALLLEDLPDLRTAFLDGAIGVTRVSMIAHTLALHGHDVRSRGQSAALAWHAEGMSHREIRDRLDELCIALDPDQAARDRDSYREHQDVRIRPDRHGHATVDATVPVTAARGSESRIAALTGRVCADDPRTPGQLRVAALDALIAGRDHLPCQCGQDSCPDALDDRPAPVADDGVLVVVHTDAPTLVGLHTDVVPWVDGMGPIDPDLTRPLAADATWRAINDDAHLSHRTPVRAPDGWRRGVDRPAGAIVEPTSASASSNAPPTAATTYAPSRALREWLHMADQTCRFPGCDHPAQRCEIDHQIPFDHSDPAHGGLTVRENTAPLCTPHHQLKTAGIWRADMRPDRAIVWTHTLTGQTFTTRPRH